MGKGDKKTKRGKITQGSYGVRRPRKKKTVLAADSKPKVSAKAEPKVKTEAKAKAKVKTEPKETPKPKKTAKKKVDE